MLVLPIQGHRSPMHPMISPRAKAPVLHGHAAGAPLGLLHLLARWRRRHPTAIGTTHRIGLELRVSAASHKPSLVRSLLKLWLHATTSHTKPTSTPAAHAARHIRPCKTELYFRELCTTSIRLVALPPAICVCAGGLVFVAQLSQARLTFYFCLFLTVGWMKCVCWVR